MPITSVKRALEWVAKETGRSVEKDRAELLDKLNDARRLFYSLNQRIRLDFHIEACFPVQTFFEPCGGCECPQTYLGVTLPQEMEQVEAAWAGTQPITIYNRWLEYQDGIQGRGNSLKMVDVGNDFPLQIDWEPGKCIKPAFVATNNKDFNKKVTVSFTNANGEERTETITLCQAGSTITSEAMTIKRPGGIVLPPDLVGAIEVFDCMGGKHLGYLSAAVEVPAFRRVKIVDACCGALVRIRGTRRYTDVQFDWEVIETDNKLAILEALRYLEIMAVKSSDAQWLAKARNHMDNVIQYLGGDNLRDEGPTVVRRFDFGKLPLRKSRLFSRRYSNPR